MGTTQAGAAPGGKPLCPLTEMQIRRILETSITPDVRTLAMQSDDGSLDVRASRTALVGAGSERSRSDTFERTASVVVWGSKVATLTACGAATAAASLERAAQAAASRIADAWTAADELESLTSEIVHAYEELHLLYELGEVLSGQLSVTDVVDLILEKVSTTLKPAWMQLSLSDPHAPVFVRSSQRTTLGTPHFGEDEYHLAVTLSSEGKTIGMLALARATIHEPFSSGDAKLLDAVGTLASKAIHNAQLYGELQRQAEAMHSSEAYLHSVMDNVAEGILTVDALGVIESVNAAAERLFGFPMSDVVGRHFGIIFAAAHDAGVSAELKHHLIDGNERPASGAPREEIGRRRDGTTFPIEVTLTEMHLDTERRFILSLRDISERKKWEAMLERQALYDPLTGLPNRVLFNDRLQLAVEAALRDGRACGLLVIDLDRFKEVNDTHGHHCGDLLLQQVGPRLRDVLQDCDTVARLGGDEFALVLPKAADADAASQTALAILNALERPFTIEGHEFRVSASIGVAVCPEFGKDSETLLRRADIAMYAAKHARCGYSIYTPGQDQSNATRIELLRQLHVAIEQDQLVLHYQPAVDLKTGEIDHVEALVRWHHPQYGLLPPEVFVPLAEQSGLIGPLSRWVLNTALRQCRLWKQAGFDINIAVNLSAQNVQDPRLPNMIAAMLKTWELPESVLSIEVTESMLLSDPGQAIEVLSRLRTMGIKISIDDFGTGYSSLTYLKRLPVDEIKIDKSFVLQMMLDPRDAAIVRSAINLSHEFDLKVVAEGIEEQATRDVLVQLGCDMAQGYFWCKPVPALEIVPWLEQSRRALVESEPELAGLLSG